MTDPAELAALSGSPVPMMLRMSDGTSIGPGMFGTYQHFVQEGDVSIDALPAEESALLYGIKSSADGKLTFAAVSKITEVVPASGHSSPGGQEPTASGRSRMSTDSLRSKAHRDAVVDVMALGEVLKEGELEKYATATFHLHPWQRRTFHLHKVGLAYYTEKQDHQKLIPVSKVSSLRLEEGDRFEIHLIWTDSGKADTHRLRAATNEQTKEWHEAMRAAWGYSSTE